MNNLHNLKKGDKAFQLMERHNPQLGVYYVWTECKVVRNPKTTVLVEVNRSNLSFDVITGEQRKQSKSLYGSAYYSLFTEESMKVETERLISQGYRVR